MPNRRDFIRYSFLAATDLALNHNPVSAQEPLNILFLGGTGFLGPHTVRAALTRGHTVTLFNRGRTNAGLFPELETIIGDRNTDDINQLTGRRWDAVIDTSAYFPRSVNMAMDALDSAFNQYVLISTISVYTTWSNPEMDEFAELRTIPDASIEEYRQPETYGALKALCERTANERAAGRVTNIRPGFIVGPEDPTDRFTYWPVRVARGGEVLAPGSGADHIQYIDVRDLADWIVHCVEQRIIGTYNAHIGARQLTMAELLGTSRRLVNESAELTWLDSAFLETQGVTPQVDMPIWLPGGMALSSDHAVSSGLRFRSVSETVNDTYSWFTSLPPARQSGLRSGISAQREEEALRAWHQSFKQ